jgi:flavin-binding protein dodecin
VADLSAPWFASLMDHVYRVTEIVGSSSNSVDEAIRHGISRATRTLRNVDWFEVTEIRGAVQDDQLTHFQVGMKVGFRLEDD